MDKLETLIDLLTRGELERAELARRAAHVHGAANDTALAWLHDEGGPRLMQAALLLQLTDVLLTSDQLDTLHERISGSFGEALPPFPSDRRDFWSDDYFEWLDEIVAARGCEVMMLPDSFEDKLAAVVVRREDTAHILVLADALKLIVEKSTQRRYA
ncbi:hypothetical protein [Dyella sp. 2RAB6]|uniref:hypothetical protein n=1 Tax=Dyella sp. 2RAB6 TaxID=3232992 RepID=UPI003F934899